MNALENDPHRDACASHRMGFWCNCDRQWDEHDGPMAEPGDDYEVSRDEGRYYGDWED